ncbi:MAG: DUF5010 C-terminal domain-containing protein [Verrucomicrobiae bacterium]|nr:DUF5010 C-terminal domain-containing protein [Verrucomicrobiae bacterium]
MKHVIQVHRQHAISSVLAVVFLSVLLAGPLPAATNAPAIIPYGTGEGNCGSNGVGQTVGVIPNPMVGDYRWGWQDPYPWGTPEGGWFPVRGLPESRRYHDEYKRFIWRAIERSQGQYDFSVIDNHLQHAQQNGRRFSFRIMILSEWEGDVDNDGNPDGKLGVPDYIESQGLGRRMPSTKSECDNIFVPYWNEPAFLNRVEALFQALGQRYDGDPRIGYVDVGIYGHWGEWHMSGLGFTNLPPELNATAATRARLVDIVAAAFPRTRLLMIPDVDGDYPDRSGLGFVHAMEQYPRMGVRKDNLSNIWFEQEVGDWFPNVRDAFQDRWKTTPFVTEFFGGENSNALALAESQVIRYHVSAVAVNQWVDDPQRIEIGKAAGHRFQLNWVGWPDNIIAGHCFVVTSRWSNVGVAPAYEDWAPTWELYNSNNTKVWSARCRLDLQRLLPTTVNADDDVNTEETEANGKNVPVTITDELAVPATLAPGTYTLKLAVLHTATNSYLAPLAIGIQGRDAQGRYTIGTVTVSAPAEPAPVVALDAPATPPVVGQATVFTPQITATNPIAAVALLVDGAVVDSRTNTPWSLTWTPTSAHGVYTVVARATDNAGRIGVSAPLGLTVQPPSNTAPVVVLSLQPSEPYVAPVNLDLEASVTDADNDAITKVEFYRGPTLIATDTQPPYTAATGNLGAGLHTLVAKAYDARGKIGVVYRTISVSNPPKGPYGGTAPFATDRIELENYDTGGEGISWHDTTAENQGGVYRSDSVDIQTTGDTGGGYHIGWVDANEWLEYTVRVPATAAYHLQLRLASPPNVAAPVIHLTVDGQPAWTHQVLPRTGRWDWDFENWTTWQTSTPVTIPQGLHVLRLTFASGLANYNWMTLLPAQPLGYTAWAAHAGLDGPAALPAADPDGDGLANLLEYALGGNPLSSASAPFPQGRISGSHLQFTFARNPAAPDVIYTIEGSFDLQTWTPLATCATGGGPWTVHDSGAGISDINGFVTYTDSANTRSVSRRFLRLRIHQP